MLTVSESMGRELQSVTGVAWEKVLVAENGIDTDVFTPDGDRHPEAPTAPYLVYAGTASEWQGAEVFAEAMPRVLAEVPTARLVFLGQGSSWPRLERLRLMVPEGQGKQAEILVAWNQVDPVYDALAQLAVSSMVSALNSEITALSSRDFFASLACRPARMERHTATAAAAAAITAKAKSRPVRSSAA